MEQWYALFTIPGREQKAAELFERTVSCDLWSCSRIPGKIKVFRSGGLLHLQEDIMFPGYVFVKTSNAKSLSDELHKIKAFPQFIGNRGEMLAPVEEKDLHFLKNVCGENLQQVMGVTRIILNNENRIVRADGVLEHYRDQIVKLNLHKRFAVVEVELFNRIQSVLFGVRLEQDQAG